MMSSATLCHLNKAFNLAKYSWEGGGGGRHSTDGALALPTELSPVQI